MTGLVVSPLPNSTIETESGHCTSATVGSDNGVCLSPQKKRQKVDGDVQDAPISSGESAVDTLERLAAAMLAKNLELPDPAVDVKLDLSSDDIPHLHLSVQDDPLTSVDDLAPAAEPPICESDIPSRHSPPPPFHNVRWSVAAEKGYRGTPAAKIPIHPELEDVHWPEMADIKDETDSTYSSQTSETTLCGAKIFILADGHGGAEAPKFFVANATRVIRSLLESRPWDFGNERDQNDFKKEVRTAFQILDASYGSRKVEEFRRWNDGAQKGIKPVDDGCTLVVNILHGEYFCNINVGDSRTVVAKRTSAETPSTCTPAPTRPWTVVFASSDHNMTHPAKIHHIQTAGGWFVYPFGSLRTMVIPKTPEPREQPYNELLGMRIYRPLSERMRAVGVSNRRTLNLSATMGDLSFKIEPAVLSCLPDVSFVPLDTKEEYVIVAATDGVWDHLKTSFTDSQNLVVMNTVGSWLDGQGDASGEEDTSSEDITCSVQEENTVDAETASARTQVAGEDLCSSLSEEDRLRIASVALVERQPLGCQASGISGANLFTPRLCRYDDATAFIIHLTKADL
ncbi:phosphatase 2C-like domain-containing protein [Gaertneriomyces semiglobifer]|nr:phosphatase 2C-like domain-containing protein [Gaertneriomyces semiglobifer]